MIADQILSHPRFRRLTAGLFLVVTSVIAGYGAYHGKLKILGLLGLFTLGFLLRQASIRNAYWLVLTTLQLADLQHGRIRDEFETDRWLALAAFAALSIALAVLHLDKPAWPGLLHLMALSLLVLLAASSTWSLDPDRSLARAASVGLVFCVAFVGLWSYGTDVDRIRAVTDVHLDSLWWIFPLGVVLWLLERPGMISGGRFESFFENPNALGMWCSLGLPLAFGMALTHPVEWRRRAAAILVGSGCFVTVMSGSRGGVMGAGLGIGVYAGLRYSRKVLALALVGGIVGGFLMLYGVDVLGRSDTLQMLVRPETLGDLSSRKIWWQLGTVIAQQKPWLGHGFGTGESLFAVYGVDQAFDNFGATVHNSYLSAWMEVGYLGAGLLIGSGLWGCWLAYRTWKREPESQEGLLALALMGSIIALMAHAFVEEKLLNAGNPWMLPYWVSLALCARLHRIQSARFAEAAEEARVAARPKAAWAQPRPAGEAPTLAT